MYRSFTRPVSAILTLSAAFGLGAAGAEASTLKPLSVVVSTPSGSTDTDPFTDDVLLDSLTFDDPNSSGSVTYNGIIGSFVGAGRFEVLTGRTEINAEFGDNDDGSDGDDNPFVKAGLIPAGTMPTVAQQESTDPAFQDAALLNAFNSRSLSEITDGENRGNEHSFKTSFAQSLAFDDVGGDGLPDIVFFERGGNDDFYVELITGGTFKNPIYSTALPMSSTNFADAGFSINTVEINGAQKIMVGGFDLDAFELTTGDSAFGFRLTTTGGPDLGGFFLAAEDPAIFGDPISAVPLPASLWVLLSALGVSFGVSRRRRAGGHATEMSAA